MPASLRAPTLLFLFTLIAGACVAAPPLGDTDEGVLTGIEQILRDPPPSLVGRRLGLITNHLRLPLVPLSNELQQKVAQYLKQFS